MKRLAGVLFLCALAAMAHAQNALIANFARALIAEDAVTTNETDITVSVITNFPTIGATNEYYYLVLVRQSDLQKEIVKVTSNDVPNRVLTVVRGQDGTSPLAFVQNDRAELWLTAGALNDRYEDLIAKTNLYFIARSNSVSHDIRFDWNFTNSYLEVTVEESN